MPNNNYSIQVPIHELALQGVGAALGFAVLSAEGGGTAIILALGGLKLPDGEYGFHLHERGTLEPGEVNGTFALGGGAGGHYDPDKTGAHRGPYRAGGHKGDLPKIRVKNGRVEQRMTAPLISLPEFAGRTLIIHSENDNYSDSPHKNGGCVGRYAGGIVIPAEWDKKVCPISGKIIARSNPAGKSGFCCKSHQKSWEKAESNPLLSWRSETSEPKMVPATLRTMTLRGAEDRYRAAWAKTPFEINLFIDHGIQDNVESKESLRQFSGGVPGMVYIIINIPAYNKFWEHNAYGTLAEAMRYPRGDNRRESAFTPHMVMHRLGDSLIAGEDAFFLHGNNKLYNFYSATPEVKELARASLSLRNLERRIVRQDIYSPLETAAGRLGAIKDPTNLFAEVFARYVISGKFVYNVRNLSPDLIELRDKLEDTVKIAVAALRSTSSVWDITAE